MIIAVDVGTSSIKAGLVNENGVVVRDAVLDIPMIMSSSSSAEHDLRSIWDMVLQSIKTVSRGFENKVEAIALSVYLHGLAVLDGRFNILTNVMTHLDRRCAPKQIFLEKWGRDLYERTGCPPTFVLPLCKIIWLKEAGTIRPSVKLSFVKDYIIYRLSKIHAVDPGIASGTGLLNIHTLKWDSFALQLAEIDDSYLPELVEDSKVLEYVSLPEIGLTKVALVPGGFDGALQNVGYGVFERQAILSLGSTAVVRAITRDVVLDRSDEMRFFSYYAAEGYRVVGGASNNGMVVIDWLKKILGTLKIDVGGNPACSEGVYALPFIGGERYPFRDPNLSLTITGLRLEHTVSHIVKGIVEGIGFVLSYIVRAIEENGKTIDAMHCAGGGCLQPDMVRLISNVIGKPIAIHKNPRNAVVLGASVLALKALGYIKSIAHAYTESSAVEQMVLPEEDLSQKYAECLREFIELVVTMRRLGRRDSLR
uniref:Carbohydrate kinase n=1 Tax=Ignisphaera aggregans TaxID=334771 RepID=A0A7C2Z937_9CREN